MNSPLKIVALVYENFLLLDLAGPVGAFEITGNFTDRSYDLKLVSLNGGGVRSSSGIVVETRKPENGPIDLLLIPGGAGAPSAALEPRLNRLLRTLANRAKQTASVCTGSFLLAEAGLLDGRRVTTHWGQAAKLARAFPATVVDSDCIYIKDGEIWTSAGITAGIDMALAVIEQDHGFAVAQRVAQSLVVYHRRPGGQSQFSAALELQGPDGRFGTLLEWAREHLQENLSIDRMAEQFGLSTRQFSRAFIAATGMSPGKAVERLRVDRARPEVAAGQEGLEVIARRHGFGSAVRMRRAFIRVLGHPPQAVRREQPHTDLWNEVAKVQTRSAA